MTTVARRNNSSAREPANSNQSVCWVLAITGTYPIHMRKTMATFARRSISPAREPIAIVTSWSVGSVTYPYTHVECWEKYKSG